MDGSEDELFVQDALVLDKKTWNYIKGVNASLMSWESPVDENCNDLCWCYLTSLVVAGWWPVNNKVKQVTLYRGRQ